MGEIVGDARSTEIDIFDFKTRTHNVIRAVNDACDDSIATGHGGGDYGILVDLYKYLTGEIDEICLSEIGISTDNHMIAFAAEHSRKTGDVVDVEEYKKTVQLIYKYIIPTCIYYFNSKLFIIAE